MATIHSYLSPSLPLLPSYQRTRLSVAFSLSSCRACPSPSKFRTSLVVRACSLNHDCSSQSWYQPSDSSKKSVISKLIQEIEPLDVSLIQKDVPSTTVDAMKRTISGMLGLLPSDQFKVMIEALWQPLSKLLVSSMMTGYTLRNAEYRLCLERNLDIFDGTLETQRKENTLDLKGVKVDSTSIINFYGKTDLSPKAKGSSEEESENSDMEGLGKMSPEAQDYICHLQSRLSSIKKELHDVKRKNAALQMQQFVGEEENDLLDYLRSLQPEKVAELSEPTCSEVKEIIRSVVHGLLATLSPKMHSQAPPLSESTATRTHNIGNEDCAELVENTPPQFQPVISLTRDYLARLLFWCMLLGHYLRGLEYRVELKELLCLTTDITRDETLT